MFQVKTAAGIPNKMANAVGTLISEEYGDSINTFVYTLDQSISSYLVGIHCGPYARVASNFEGIERIIPVEYYAKASDTAAMKNSFSNLVHAFDIYATVIDIQNLGDPPRQ